MRGLFQKIYIEVRWQTLLFGLGLALIMFLLTALLPKILSDADRFMERLKFVRPLLKALLGTDPGDGFSEKLMQAFLWVHPTVLATTWAHAVIYATRCPAGETDRGTIDFLMSLPVSRWQLYIAETTGLVVSSAFVICTGFAGHIAASGSLQPQMRPDALATTGILINLLAVVLCVGTVTFLVSAGSDRRGRAGGLMFAVLVISFLLAFLAQFWKQAEPWAVLSIIQYYQPARIIQSGRLPLADLGILSSVSIACWTTGGIIFNRRDVCTV